MSPDTDELEFEERDPEDLRTPVVDHVAAPTSREPDLLPFHDRTWEDFERILCLMADRVDGLRSVRLYGVRGQNQHGIDLYGIDPDGRRVAYQAKRTNTFTADDLTTAVTRFAEGHRPVDAERMVVCTACITDRTEMSERLEALREAHDFEIGFEDGRSLSESLRTRPDLVRRLFGQAWVVAFCDGTGWEVPQPAATDVVADALVRGPVEGLGLTAALDEVEGLVAGDPGEAADKLVPIVDTLIDAGFGGTTATLRHQRAELLVAAGRIHDAADEWALQCWNDANFRTFDRGDLGYSKLRSLAEAHDLAVHKLIVQAIEQVENWHAHPSPRLETLVDLCVGLAANSSVLRDDILLWTAETLVAIRAHDEGGVVSALADDALARRAGRGLGDESSVRLRLAVADLGGDWTELIRDARAGRFGARSATIVHARYGRRCLLTDRPEDSEAEYLQAVQTAVAAGLPGEAADALRSITRGRVWFGFATEDLNVLPRLANDISASGSNSLLLSGRDPFDSGSEALVGEAFPKALRYFRAALRHTVIRGDFAGEVNARHMLSVVMTKVDERLAAIGDALLGGSTKDVDAAGPIPGYIDLRSALLDGPHWERATSMHVVAAEIDLVPDEHVDDYVRGALAGIHEPDRSWFGPHVGLRSWHLLALLGDRMTEDQASTVLELLLPLTPRDPGKYRHTDDDHAHALALIAATFPALVDRAVTQMAAIIKAGDHFGDTVRQQIHTHLDERPALLLDELNRLADAGNAGAAKALDEAGVLHPTLVDEAADAVQRILDAPEPLAGHFNFGTALPSIAQRARHLGPELRARFAEHCMALAENTARPESNRSEGIEGVLSLAGALNSEHRRSLYPRAFQLAQVDQPPTAVDAQFAGGLHPLSAFQFNLDHGSLHRDALRASARLAVAPDEADAVVVRALSWLGRDKDDVYAAVHSLSLMRADLLPVDTAMFASHPLRWVRQLGVVLASRQPDREAATLRAFAVDQDPTVRMNVGLSLSLLAEPAPELTTELRAMLWNDPNWSVRRLARSTPDEPGAGG